MGHQTTVYGAVLLLRTNPRVYPDADEINARALASLPETDEWPFLVRSMFSLTESSTVSVEYTYRVLHFGASYKEVEFEWEEWLAKFEALLSRMQGISATVHMESEHFGVHMYEWFKPTSAEAWTFSPWEFRGGRRKFNWEENDKSIP